MKWITLLDTKSGIFPKHFLFFLFLMFHYFALILMTILNCFCVRNEAQANVLHVNVLLFQYTLLKDQHLILELPFHFSQESVFHTSGFSMSFTIFVCLPVLYLHVVLITMDLLQVIIIWQYELAKFTLSENCFNCSSSFLFPY